MSEQLDLFPILSSPWCELDVQGYRFMTGHGKPVPDFEEVGLLFAKTLELGDSYQFGIGDLYRYAEDRFGEQAAQLVEAKRIRPKTLMNFVYVCRRLPRPKRVDGLPFSHHAAAAACFGDPAHPDWEEAGQALLEEALAKGLTEDEVTERSQQIRGVEPQGEAVNFEKRAPADRVAWLVTKVQNLQKDLQELEWDPEVALLQSALDQLHLTAESIKNRAIGEPAEPSTPAQPHLLPEDEEDIRPAWLQEQSEGKR